MGVLFFDVKRIEVKMDNDMVERKEGEGVWSMVLFFWCDCLFVEKLVIFGDWRKYGEGFFYGEFLIWVLWLWKFLMENERGMD